ncbi:uncharacterized protein PRCAT00001195001 [Priceomyces carsonii]|uniref:uncharacterized protein n=1 Tax=Priceomyces carsonii TaxID=28549 RepID=UPI002ED86EB1|nr:unnamed protein product [Priceomyces carsonii]
MFKVNRSTEDLHGLGQRRNIDRRRARSSSPVKNRRFLPSNSQGEFSRSLEDLRSVCSGGSNLSYEQLKLLSNSPISRRLHINSDSSKYVIPIPFTLQLPPKLSQKNIEKERSRSPSPLRLPPRRGGTSRMKQTKLIYTGLKYEKIGSLSESELEEEEINIKLNEISRRPPPVSQNKSKALKYIHKSCLSSLDVLSVIEEASLNEKSSRRSSVKSIKSKLLPALPARPLENKQLPSIAGLGDAIKSTKIPTNYTLPSLLLNRRPSGRIVFAHTPTVEQNENTSSRLITDPNLEEEKPLRPISNLVTSLLPRSRTQDNLSFFLSDNVPVENRDHYLKIHKRSFSDESYVSSAVSFTSGCESMSYNLSNQSYGNIDAQSDYISRNPKIFASSYPSNRIQSSIPSCDESETSFTTDDSECTEKSWDSTKKSINLDNRNSELDSTHDESAHFDPAQKELPPRPQLLHSPNSIKNITNLFSIERTGSDTCESSPIKASNSYSNSNSASDSDSENECITRTVSKLYQSSGEPLIESNICDDSLNNGAGKMFSFPNNSSNATNSDEARKLLTKDSTSSGKAPRCFKPGGVIVIPDLEEIRLSSHKSLGPSCSHNGIAFDDIPSESSKTEESSGSSDCESELEPIGVPTSAAKSVIQDQFKLVTNAESDTDSEPAKVSLYSDVLISRSTPNLLLDDNKHKPAAKSFENSVARDKNYSPACSKHRRRKSMYSIDFFPENDNRNDDLTASATSAHVKSKSVDFALLNEELSLLKCDSKPSRSMSNDQKPVDNEIYPLKINIAEPPSKVDYAIDFNEAEDLTQRSADNMSERSNDIKLRTKTKSHNPSSFGKFDHFRKDLNKAKRKSSGGNQSSTSYSSYQSSRSLMASSLTSLSDNNSVVIDLTKEKYDICTIQRNNSTQSYKSVTEKTKDGKHIEVVLVDEEDRDELESIYSKYLKSSWLKRAESMVSQSSVASSVSFESKADSTSQLKLKDRDELVAKYKKSLQDLRANYGASSLKKNNSNRTSNVTSSSLVSSAAKKLAHTPNGRKVSLEIMKHERKELNLVAEETKYFDFSKSNYDFSSFMEQRQND